MRSNPFDDIEDILDRFGRQIEGGIGVAGGAIPVDIIDEGDTIRVVADLPGYDRDDIELHLAGETLHIDASEPDDRLSGQVIRRERHDRGASRRVRLPDAIDESGVTAEYDRGVLRIELPRRDGGRGTTIDVE